jgi:hypothetical protein
LIFRIPRQSDLVAYTESASWQQRALIEHPSATWVHRTLCPHLLVGAKPEARRSLGALRVHYPELTMSEVQRGLPPLPQSVIAIWSSSEPCARPVCRREDYFEGIATLRPTPPGRGKAACAFATA